MEAILKFNLPEEKDEFTYACNGVEYMLALDEIREYLRSEIKYKDLSSEQYEYCEKIYDKFFEIINNRSIEL
jgi:hypothetical protein